eukprot:1180397-Prorocentrum_minimum.AAC.2
MGCWGTHHSADGALHHSVLRVVLPRCLPLLVPLPRVEGVLRARQQSLEGNPIRHPPPHQRVVHLVLAAVGDPRRAPRLRAQEWREGPARRGRAG